MFKLNFYIGVCHDGLQGLPAQVNVLHNAVALLLNDFQLKKKIVAQVVPSDVSADMSEDASSKTDMYWADTKIPLDRQ